MPIPIRRNGLTKAGPIKDGQTPSADWMNRGLADSVQEVLAGPGIAVHPMGRKVMISAIGGVNRVGGVGNLIIIDYTVFPAIPGAFTMITLGSMIWHAGPGDTVWTLDSFVASEATGVVGTDVTGSVP